MPPGLQDMLQPTDWNAASHKFIERAMHRLRLEPADSLVGFSPLYRALHPPQQAGRDFVILRAVAQSGRDAAELRKLPNAAGGRRRNLRIFSLDERPLDELTPVIANLGLRVFDQRQFDVGFGSRTHYIRSFTVEPTAKCALPFQTLKGALESALARLLAGEIENDGLNRLIGLAAFEWREISLLRAYSSYRLQLGASIGRDRIYEALLNNVDAARLLYVYFETRFNPENPEGRFEALSAIRQRLISVFQKVEDVTDDRILRDIFNLIDATLRTNFFLPGDPTKRALALKIDTMGVFNAPNPRPFAEIYVRAGSFEGVHLRGAKVARGGLRWSDRLEDYRSEILDLMQTQMVKNALIVPQGAKGGFVLKTACADRDARQQLGKRAYGDFIRGLLDVTDNIGNGAAHSPRLVAYDNVDPYLVVAADKGTATWSDEANRIAKSYSFWLGDAFATGGSHGYHHKRLGITARGAWVCVRRHFRELGRDIDNHPFTVVGVGSMDGDVFGNGMLQSSKICLLGAFSGQHIFLDPNPDPAASFAERRRLFETPNSSWADYDRKLISPGGGVFRRDAKDIELSEEVRNRLRVRHRFIDSDGLVRLLLCAPVDLLWMGGIGTYIKASTEKDEDADDRVNDGARVDGAQLRAKIVGEGANLGFTQRARVEYALRGGRINTDAVDNSAGVDLSDHEVNLKILLRSDSRPSDVGGDARNKLLTALTEDVCASVLDDNDRQSLCLSLERARSVADIEPFLTLAEAFEVSGVLDRQAEAFPSRRDLATRSAKGLTRPEHAPLMALAKLSLKRQLLDVPEFLDAEWTQAYLLTYFPPQALAQRADMARRHPLAREITACVTSNKIINQAGACFLNFGDAAAPRLLLDAVALYLTFDRILNGDAWRDAVRKLDGKMDTDRQYERLLQLEGALSHLCRWGLQRGRLLSPVEPVISEWRRRLHAFLAHFSYGEEVTDMLAVAPESSHEFFLNRLRDFPFLVELVQQFEADMRFVATRYYEAAAFLDLRGVSALLAAVGARDHWERQLQTALGDRMRAAPARIVALEIRLGIDEPVALFDHAGTVFAWTRTSRLLAELLNTQKPLLVAFATFVAELDSLLDACEERCAGLAQAGGSACS